MDVEQLIDKMAEAGGEDDDVSLDEIVDVLGRRSFGPLLLLAGLITLAPLIGDIPGMPTIMGMFVLLVAVQLLLNREHFWLPRWLLKKSISRDKFCKALDWIRPAARFLDRWLRPRLTGLVQGVGTRIVAALCILIAAAMPLMEVVPFSANGAGAALTALGLALVIKDGLLALIAFLLIAATSGLIIYHLVL